MTLETQRIQTLEQLQAFLEGSAPLGFSVPERRAVYAWMADTLSRSSYARLKRRERGLLVRYLGKVSGLSRQQVTRLVAQWRRTGRIEDRRGRPARPFVRRYTPVDVALLAEVDALHGTLSGPAPRKLCERVLRAFGDKRFVRLARHGGRQRAGEGRAVAIGTIELAPSFGERVRGWVTPVSNMGAHLLLAGPSPGTRAKTSMTSVILPSWP